MAIAEHHTIGTELPVIGSDLELVSANELPEYYIHDIAVAEHRIIIQSMSMTYSAETEEVLDAVMEKAGTIPLVRVLASDFSQRFDDAHLVVNPFGRHAKNVRKFVHFMTELQARGTEECRVEAGFCHQPVTRRPRFLTNPYAGQNHDKTAVADDIVYDFGGVDLKTTGFSNLDSMFRFTSRVWADERDRRSKLIYENNRLDTTADLPPYILDEHSYVIVDTGQPGRSAIYEEVTRLVDDSEVTGITFLSQMTPEGELAQILEVKQRELGAEKVVVASNRPSKLVLPARLKEAVLSRFSDLELSYPENHEDYLHEKILIVYFKDKPTLVIKGSHNMLEQGVTFGTAEQMLFSTDPIIVAEVEDRVGRLAFIKT